MATWQRARIDERCGRCNQRVRETDPILVRTLEALSPTARRRVRCQVCVGESPDQGQLDQFDEAAERAAIVADGAPAPFEFSGATKPLPFDAKQAQTGERD